MLCHAGAERRATVLIRFICVGAACGTLVGALQPVLMGMGGFNAVPILTAEYSLVGGGVGFALFNYLRFRRRVLQRVEEATRTDLQQRAAD